MVHKYCVFYGCLSNNRSKVPVPGLRFLPFPKPKTNLKRAERWCYLSGRADFTVDKITRHHYICNLHFPRGANLDLKENPGLEPKSVRLKTRGYVPIEPIDLEAVRRTRRTKEEMEKEKAEQEEEIQSRLDENCKVYARNVTANNSADPKSNEDSMDESGHCNKESECLVESPSLVEDQPETEPCDVITLEDQFVVEDVMEALRDIDFVDFFVMETDWIVIQRSRFDVFLENQPYTTLQLLVNLSSKRYLVRVWGRTIDQGKMSTAEDLRNICIRKFDFSVVCKGMETRVNDKLVHLDYPVSRYVSQDCSQFFQVGLGLSFRDQTSEQKLDCVSLCGQCTIAQNTRRVAPLKPKAPEASTGRDEAQPMGTQEKATIETSLSEAVEEVEEETSDYVPDMSNTSDVESAGKTIDLDHAETIGHSTLTVGSIEDTEEHTKQIENQIKTHERERQKMLSSRRPSDHGKKPYDRALYLQKKASLKAKLEADKVMADPSKPGLLNQVKILEKGPVDVDIPIEFRAETLLCKCGKFASKVSEKRVDSQPELEGDNTEGSQKVEEMFQCSECNKKFMRVKMLLKKPKPKAKPKAKKSESSLIPGKCYTCKICSAKFTDVSQYLDHHQTHTAEREPSEKPEYSCSLCDLKFPTERKLINHYQKNHSKTVPKAVFFCELCGEETMNQGSTIARHMAKKHDIGHKCEICDKVFESVARLASHQELHSDPKYPCKFCDKLFKTKNKAQKHEDQVHNLVERIDVVCEVCNRKFINVVSFNRHIRENHPESLHQIISKSSNARKVKMRIEEEERKKRRMEEEERKKLEEEDTMRMEEEMEQEQEEEEEEEKRMVEEERKKLEEEDKRRMEEVEQEEEMKKLEESLGEKQQTVVVMQLEDLV